MGSSNIQELVNSQTNAVLMFGHMGSGKSTFLTMLFYYFRNTYPVLVNPTHNRDGVLYINNMLENFQHGKLPERTSPNTIIEFDLAVLPKDDSKRVFTFIDCSGEELRQVEALELQQADDKKILQPYLEAQNLKKTILLFLDSTRTNTQERLIYIFLNYVGNFMSLKGMKIALILTKWDLVGTYTNLDDFLRDKTPQLYHWFEHFKQNSDIDAEVFSFSIGQLKEGSEGKTNILENIDLSYTKIIAEWLLKNEIYDKKARKEQHNWVRRLFGKKNP